MAGTTALGLSSGLRTRPIRNRPRTPRWGQGRTQTRSYVFDIRRASFTISLTTCDFRVATTSIDHTNHAHSYLPTPRNSQRPCTTFTPTDSCVPVSLAASSTNTDMLPELQRRLFERHRVCW